MNDTKRSPLSWDLLEDVIAAAVSRFKGTKRRPCLPHLRMPWCHRARTVSFVQAIDLVESQPFRPTLCRRSPSSAFGNSNDSCTAQAVKCVANEHVAADGNKLRDRHWHETVEAAEAGEFGCAPWKDFAGVIMSYAFASTRFIDEPEFGPGVGRIGITSGASHDARMWALSAGAAFFSWGEERKNQLSIIADHIAFDRPY